MERKGFVGAAVAALAIGLVVVSHWDLRTKFVAIEGRLDGRESPESGVAHAGDETLQGKMRELTRKVARLEATLPGGSAPSAADLPTGLRADVEQLAVQVADLRRGLDAMELRFAAIGGVPQNPQAAAIPGPETGGMRPKEKKIDPSKQIQARHDEEIRSEQWAARMETAVQAEFANNPAVAGIQIGGLDCRTTLCRLTWQFPEGLSNENAFILENEFMFALQRVGLNAGRSIRGTTGSSEGIFWRNEAPPRAHR